MLTDEERANSKQRYRENRQKKRQMLKEGHIFEDPKYMNGKIYVIRSHSTDDIYVGSTYGSLGNRHSRHKTHYRFHSQGRPKYGYISSFEIVKHGDSYIELLEEYPCKSNDQLTAREGWWMRLMPCVNKRIPRDESPDL